MKTYSMIFLDIDGTLLDSQNEISSNTQKLLNRLEKRNIPVVLCSARSPSGVGTVSRQGNIHGPQVCYSGALILDADYSIIEENSIPIQQARQIRDYISSNLPDICTSTYIYDVWMVDSKEHPAIANEMEITQCEPIEGTLEDTVSDMDHVHKLLCIGPHPQIRKLQIEGSKRFPDISFVYSKPTYLEITARSASKARAVQAVREFYHVPAEKTVAIGDNYTDIDMIQAAGLGVAMGNAPEAVKREADRVTATNDEEGVFIALKNLHYRADENI